MVTSDEVAARVAGQTVATRFRDTVQRHPDRVALRWKDGDAWRELTWAEYGERSCRLATALSAAGVVHGEQALEVVDVFDDRGHGTAVRCQILHLLGRR